MRYLLKFFVFKSPVWSGSKPSIQFGSKPPVHSSWKIWTWTKPQKDNFGPVWSRFRFWSVLVWFWPNQFRFGSSSKPDRGHPYSGHQWKKLFWLDMDDSEEVTRQRDYGWFIVILLLSSRTSSFSVGSDVMDALWDTLTKKVQF